MIAPLCGTTSGYQHHHRNLEHPCAACRNAQRRQSARQRYVRQSGRTPEAAFYVDCHATAIERLRARAS